MNRCLVCDEPPKESRSELECLNPEEHQGQYWVDGKQPLGKILKPHTYTPANIAGILAANKESGQ